VMLGGAWVPTFVFPEWLQKLTAYVPTRWAIDGLEAVTWRGLGFEAAIMPIAAMLGASVVFAMIAMRRFQWEE
jgi:linearmycin/streptolysin S transport system permease protein